MAIETFFEPEKLFCTQDVKLYPQKIRALAEIRKVPDAEVDIIITAHDLPQMTNITIKNYLLFERQTKIHIIVVDSSTKESVFNELIDHERVTKILLRDDTKIKGHVHGYGSYGMALSAAIGGYISRAPLLFFSHSDMIACRENFLTYLKSKLSNTCRLASFTQRHIIPFMAGMLLKRETYETKGIDWLPLDQNPMLETAGLKGVAETVFHLNHVDCGEQFIYSELAARRPVYTCASMGGSQDWWKDPMSYYDPTSIDSSKHKTMSAEDLKRSVAQSGASLVYAPLNCTREAFENQHRDLIRAGHEGFLFFEKPKWWRYSFDDAGKLIFIHHGRGTTLKAVKRWLRYGNRYNEKLSRSTGASL